MPACRQGGPCKLSGQHADPWEYSQRLAVTQALYWEELGVCSFVSGLCSLASDDRYFSRKRVVPSEALYSTGITKGGVGGPRSIALEDTKWDQSLTRGGDLKTCGFCSAARISFSSDQLSVTVSGAVAFYLLKRSTWKLPFASWDLTLICRNW